MQAAATAVLKEEVRVLRLKNPILREATYWPSSVTVKVTDSVVV